MKRLFTSSTHSAVSWFLQRFVSELQIKQMSFRRNISFVDVVQHGAVRLRYMMAVSEAALAQHGFEFGKCPFQHALGEMVEAKLLRSG